MPVHGRLVPKLRLRTSGNPPGGVSLASERGRGAPKRRKVIDMHAVRAPIRPKMGRMRAKVIEIREKMLVLRKSRASLRGA